MKIVALIGLFIVFSVVTCERITQPPISKAVVELVPEAVMVTEAWFSIKTERPDAGLTVALERDGKEVLRLAGLKDTVVADSGLQPGHGYTYRLRLYRSDKVVGPTPPVSITTLDTTSNDIEWTVYEIPSPYGSGVLYDVAIVDENDIWAVGEIYSDSNQTWLPYNAVHWDGEKWELKKIIVEYRGQSTISPLESVLALQNGKIIFSSGLPYLPENEHWDIYHLWDMGILGKNDGSLNSIWGTSLNNLYFTGRKGTIVHYDGKQWHRIESGTDLAIQDIWGAKRQHSLPLIYAVASNPFHDNRVSVIGIQGNHAYPVSHRGLPGGMKGIWSWRGYTWYSCGNGLYRKEYSDSIWCEISDVPPIYKEAIRGSGPNNIFVVGHFGLVLHWNGSSWHQYEQFPGLFVALDVKEDMVVAVGVHVTGIVVDGVVILVGRRR